MRNKVITTTRHCMGPFREDVMVKNKKTRTLEDIKMRFLHRTHVYTLQPHQWDPVGVVRFAQNGTQLFIYLHNNVKKVRKLLDLFSMVLTTFASTSQYVISYVYVLWRQWGIKINNLTLYIMYLKWPAVEI